MLPTAGSRHEGASSVAGTHTEPVQPSCLCADCSPEPALSIPQGSCRPHPEFQGRGHKPHEVAAACLAPGLELGTEVGPYPHLLTH